jgi:hypothetical protein
VTHGPNLGLSASGVNLNDGSHSVTRIYPVFGIGNEGSTNQDKAIGNFYVQFMGRCVPTSSPGVRLQCNSTALRRAHPRVLTDSSLSPMGSVALTWKEPSN